MLIIDKEDGQIFFEGTEAEVKEWWWKLLCGGDPGGYLRISGEDYKKNYLDPEEAYRLRQEKSCSSCGK